MSITANYEFGAVPPDLLSYVKDKSKSAKYYFEYLLTRTKKMFSYGNLPDTLEHSMLERYIQVNGICCITDYKGKLYAFNGSAGGAQEVYYRPSLFVISNPHFGENFSKNVVIASQLTDYNAQPEDSQPGVLIRNDSEWIGLTPLIARYAVLMSENCVTIRSADIMLRIIAMISANNDKALKSAKEYLKRIENGDLGVIGSSQFSNSIEMQSPPSNNGSYLTQFIELQQYLKASFFNELGLRANYNMKREALGEGETSIDEESVLPLCEDMLQCRREDMQKVNEMYGTNITVDFSSAWLESRLSRTASLISQLSEAGLVSVEKKGEENDDGIREDAVRNTSETGNREGTFEEDAEGKDQDEGRLREEESGNDVREPEISRESEGTSNSDGKYEHTSDEKGCDTSSLSEINDITDNDLLDKIEDIVEQVDLDIPEERGENDELLGKGNGTGNTPSNSDD